ncbi:MAG: ATP-binding protein [Acidimicrobiia bacterium]
MSLTTELLRFVRRAGVETDHLRILSEMTRFVARAFAVYRVSVYAYEGQKMRGVVSEYASGEIRADLWSVFRTADLDSYPIVCQLAARPRVVAHLDPSEGFPPEIVQQFEMRPYLAVPLTDDGESLAGIVVVEGDADELAAQRAEIIELAAFVSLAIQNSRAYLRERQRAREAEALLEVAAVLTHHTDLTPVLAAVAQQSARATGFDRASIFIRDDDGRLVPTMSQFADGHADLEAWHRFTNRATEVPACRAVLETGQVRIVDNTEVTPVDVGEEWWEPFGLKSLLIVPLTAWGERFGVMVLDHREARTVTDDQVRVAVGVASHGAAAIGLARLLAAEREAKEQLAELDRLKTAFVATVSHELRTPLTTIVGFTGVLPSMVSGEAAEFVDLMGRESLHLESLIANLLDTSRLEAGLLDIRRDPVDLSRVVGEAIGLVSHLHPDVAIDVDVECNMRLTAGDAARLRQVFVNLAENACKYGAGKVRVTAFPDGDGALVVVDDAGSGVPESERAAVFDRFHRLHEGQESGTGIGLYLVKALVEAHGGRVAIDDSPELGGARFSVWLPTAVAIVNE